MLVEELDGSEVTSDFRESVEEAGEKMLKFVVLSLGVDEVWGFFRLLLIEVEEGVSDSLEGGEEELVETT